MQHASPRCEHNQAGLTTNRKLVLDALLQADRAVSAYDVLQLLRGQEVHWQPPTVYRAPAFLVEASLAHLIPLIPKYIVGHH